MTCQMRRELRREMTREMKRKNSKLKNFNRKPILLVLRWSVLFGVLRIQRTAVENFINTVS